MAKRGDVSSDDLSDDTIRSIHALAASTFAPVAVADPLAIREYIVPDGYTIEALDQSHLAERPRRASGTAKLFDERSFIEYVNRFSLPDTVVFAEIDEHRVTAIFNYHSEALLSGGRTPGWGDFRAVLQIAYSDGFADWRGLVAKGAITQTEFAYWLEQHIPDVSTPDGATLLGIIRTLKVTRDFHYEKVVHLPTGLATKLEVSVNDRARGGDDIELPERITLGLPVFVGADPEPIEVFLRYDLNAEGRMLFRLEFDRGIERLIRERFRAVVDRIGDRTEIPAWLGVPPAPIGGR